MTAQAALFEKGQLEPGQIVLVRSGASGVGSAAVQLAAAHGAQVFASAGSPKKCAFVQSLGAECFDYRTEDVRQRIETRVGSRRVDLIVDTLGPSAWAEHCALLARGGRVVSLGLLGGSKPAPVDFGELLRRELLLRGMVLRSRPTHERIAMTRRFVRDVLPLFVDGRVRPVVDSVYPLDQIQAAHERMEQNANLGKIVLQIAG
jgi:NADPH:quinone reductase-like Zn-dependent oxidoreductase